MRRLPIFLLLDVSESMVGESLRQMQEGLESLTATLRQDPHALETVHLSVVAFAAGASTLSPLVELADFKVPRLPIGSGTSLGKGLEHLMAVMDAAVVRGLPDRKGDWKPVVFLITDGRPTDQPEAAIERWKSGWGTKATLVAVGVGSAVPLETLAKLTDQVFHLKGRTEKDFKGFIAWISQSISTQTRSVGLGKETVPFRPSDGIIRLDKDASELQYPRLDEDLVIVPGRCSTTGKPYLIRYEKPQTVDDFLQGAWNGDSWKLVDAFPVDATYFEWSESARGPGSRVHSGRLLGSPFCPHCGAGDAFVGCGCGQVTCARNPNHVTCPTCGSSGTLEVSEGGFDVGRAVG